MASGENSQQGMLRAPVAPRTGKSLLEEMPLICFLLQGRKYPLVIVSDSFDFFVTPLLQRHNLGWIPVYTNRLHQRKSCFLLSVWRPLIAAMLIANAL
jgi:phosphoserine phosphatase